MDPLAPLPLSRRGFVGAGARLALGALVGAPLACSVSTESLSGGGAGSVRLSARPPVTPPATVPAPGWHRIELDGRVAHLYVPAGHRADAPAPLLVSFHGAGGQAAAWGAGFRSIADRTGSLLLVPESYLPTWDLIRGPFDRDATFVDRALAWVFERCAVDPARIAAHGFSDGGTYALGIGLTNGDLFTHVVAFSPGFLKTGERRGKPPVFIAHGTLDGVLPINASSRRIVPQLRSAGYDVTFEEFAGGHEVWESIAIEAAEWVRG